MRLVGVIALLIAACSPERPVHTCDDWSDCGVGGACEPASDPAEEDPVRACSFVDTACSSGRRFSEFAPGDLADACVEINTPAKRGELCLPGPNACADFRECLSNRCVTVAALESNSNFFAAHCANPAVDNLAPMMLWGNTSFLQLPLNYYPFNSCDAFDCPKTCWECRLDCPGDCLTATPANPQACMDCRSDCSATPPVVCGGGSLVTSVSVGDNHVCFTNGGTFCVGANDAYQLGSPVQTGETVLNAYWHKTSCNGETPPDCVGKVHAKVAAGISHTCASFAFGSDVECWGDNEFGQRGPGAGAPHDGVLVQPFPGGGEALSVGLLSASGTFTCAATSDRVSCWGRTPTEPAGVVDELTGGSFTALETGTEHACVIDNKKVTCWGANESGQSAPGNAATNVRPTTVLPDLDFVSVAAGRAHSCAVTTTGLTYCWGDNSRAQLGEGAASPGPVVISTPTAIGPITASEDSTCALQLDDRVRCWGDVVQIGTEVYDELEVCTRPSL